MPFLGRKKKGEATGGSVKKAGSSKSKHPLSRRQSDKGRKRQQDLELLAQQDPEPRFDLSACELTEVPPGVFAVCKVLQKQVLLLQDNWLHSLAGGGDLVDLQFIRVLDLHNNELKLLPENFGCLTHLQVLDLSSNYLKDLPPSFQDLQSLQTLHLKNNNLGSLPLPILKLRYLRTLDISGNDIEELPVDLCRVKALETLVLDTDKLKFPSQDVCKKSTAAIMMYLCGQADILYEHPSKYWKTVSPAHTNYASTTNDGIRRMSEIESQMMDGVQAYQSVLDQKRKDAQELERYLNAEQEAQSELATKAAENQRKMLSYITQHQEEYSSDLLSVNKVRDKEKTEFIRHLKEIENGASMLISQLLDSKSRAKESEQLMEIMDNERLRESDWFTVKWEEVENLRKQEILDNMNIMLRESDTMEALRMSLDVQKHEDRLDALDQENFTVGQIASLIHHRDLEQKQAVEKLAQENELQKAAFEALMYSQDSTHSRLRSQIELIESELAQITAIEMDQRAKRMAHELNVMADQRITLSALLSQLLEEREKRKDELRKRLVEMELQREEGQQDYWLVQYQRLLDWKPQSLIDGEVRLEMPVKEVLISSGAEDYLAMFTRHRITWQTLLTLTDADLKQMGVHELGLRKSILKHVFLYNVDQPSSSNTDSKVKEISREPANPPNEVTPTAPPISMYPPPEPPSSLLVNDVTVTARGLYSECAICLDKQSSIIFLTCGHVCCCSECSQPIKECPLCRSIITAKIKLCLPHLHHHHADS